SAPLPAGKRREERNSFSWEKPRFGCPYYGTIRQGVGVNRSGSGATIARRPRIESSYENRIRTFPGHGPRRGGRPSRRISPASVSTGTVAVAERPLAV